MAGQSAIPLDDGGCALPDTNYLTVPEIGIDTTPAFAP